MFPLAAVGCKRLSALCVPIGAGASLGSAYMLVISRGMLSGASWLSTDLDMVVLVGVADRFGRAASGVKRRVGSIWVQTAAITARLVGAGSSSAANQEAGNR